jgi:hypothetical protein
MKVNRKYREISCIDKDETRATHRHQNIFGSELMKDGQIEKRQKRVKNETVTESSKD